MPPYFPQTNRPSSVMMFVDGENLAISFSRLIKTVDDSLQEDIFRHVVFEKDTYVWSQYANVPNHKHYDVVRKYYYTCVQGDDKKAQDIAIGLKRIGIEAPRVFKKAKGRKSKKVDITLATDVLSHAHRRNYDMAVIVAGDEDYVPLVEAIKAEGCRVAVWFFDHPEAGLSQGLKMAADFFFNVSDILLRPLKDVQLHFR